MTRPPELQAIFDAIEGGGPYESVEEVNRILAVHMREYNSGPQRELGGLSPDTMSQLLYGDWTSRGALRLTETLTLDELAGAAIFSDARTILEYVRDAGPVKETSAKNLPRAVVAALLPRLRIPAERRVTLAVDVPAPVNEGDVFWLPVMRHTLLFASLLARRKGLRITARGRTLLDDARAGELYALLFRTLFRKVNLGVLDRIGGHPQLQSTVAFSFFKLRSATRDWTAAEELAESAWLASAKDPPREWETAYGLGHFPFHHRVLDPLVHFGLLEVRLLPTEVEFIERAEYRRTPLYDRFMRFEFAERPRHDPFLMR